MGNRLHTELNIKGNNRMSKKYSIIIPTYNRPNYLRRLLSYYNKYGKDFNIIVADSSSDGDKQLNKNIISKFSKLDILYINKYSPTINLYHKLSDALDYVNTKYSVFCADDDFITPNGINKSVDFLEKNPDFTVVQGYYITFYLKPSKKGKQHFHWNPYCSYKSIIFSDAESRLAFHLSNYQLPTFYAVHRTELLKMIFKETIKYTNNDRFGEILPSMLDLVYGKMKCLDTLYGSREVISNSGGRTSKPFKDFIKEGTYDKKYTKFRECLSTHLSKKSKLTIEESKKVVDKAMSNYLKKNYGIKYKMDEILKYMRLPDWINTGLRKTYRKLCSLKQVQKDDIKNLIDNPSSKYYDDFNRIRNHVLLYSKKV